MLYVYLIGRSLVYWTAKELKAFVLVVSQGDPNKKAIIVLCLTVSRSEKTRKYVVCFPLNTG
jgi:hypothetical protein